MTQRAVTSSLISCINTHPTRICLTPPHRLHPALYLPPYSSAQSTLPIPRPPPALSSYPPCRRRTTSRRRTTLDDAPHLNLKAAKPSFAATAKFTKTKPTNSNTKYQKKRKKKHSPRLRPISFRRCPSRPPRHLYNLRTHTHCPRDDAHVSPPVWYGTLVTVITISSAGCIYVFDRQLSTRNLYRIALLRFVSSMSTAWPGASSPNLGP